MVRYFLLALTLTLSALPAAADTIKLTGQELQLVSYEVRETRSIGGNDRGAALAVLRDGTVLLGGGSNGGSIFAWRESENSLIRLGEMLTPRERLRDSRFAITDIAVLAETAKSAELLISFPRLSGNRLVEVVVVRATLDRATATLKRGAEWFRSRPRVPISAVQHAAGRMEVINSKSAYLTIGDLGFRQIDDRTKSGDLGSVFRISKSKATKISTGHRNQQGIVLFDGKTLLTSEHGPRGGDEINIIRSGVEYGWPFVTYGAPYSSGDYVIPGATGTHAGYEEPIKQWTPSVAPTELVQIPTNRFGKFAGGLVMGTLRDESLYFMRYSNGKITDTERVDVGARIRDLDLLPDQRLIATTDDGRILIFASATS